MSSFLLSQEDDEHHDRPRNRHQNRRRDPDAAERFVRTHYAAIFRLLRHLTRNREDAEDLTQQAFLAARANIGRYRGSANLRTWLHRIAFNEFRQWKRRQKHTAPISSAAAQPDVGFGSFVEGESLLSALSALSDKHREAFVLHEVEELSVAEVAHVLGVPTGTVKARLFYARRYLRSYLEEGSKAIQHEKQQTTH